MIYEFCSIVVSEQAMMTPALSTGLNGTRESSVGGRGQLGLRYVRYMNVIGKR